VVQGPITAIVLLLEMTRDISMLVPVMTSVVTATLTYRFFTRDSIYAMRLKRQGIEIRQSEADPVMKDITVWEAMTRDFPTVSPKMSVNELAAMLVRTGHHGFPVVDENGRLVGVVTLSDVESSRSRDRPDLKVEDIATKSLFVAYPDQSVYDVLLKLGARDVGRIPVVDRMDRTRLQGVLRRHDIIRAYSKKLEREV
jgi:CIC family chloride channel protein